MRARRGFTVVEVLVTGIILAIFGTMFVRYVLTQNRFADQMSALNSARSVSRTAMNILESELRMVLDSGGVDSVAADGSLIRVLVPYRMGLNCGVQGNRQFVSFLPVDSAVLVRAVYAAFGWRGHDGEYRIVYPDEPLDDDAPSVPNNANKCTGSGGNQAAISTVTFNGRSGTVLQLTPAQSEAPVGAAVMLFQRITYAFKRSLLFPGQYGLYRQAEGSADEEIMGPFDSSARFRFWADGATSAVSDPPAPGEIRGVDVVFASESDFTPTGSSAPVEATIVSSIFFRNVRAR